MTFHVNKNIYELSFSICSVNPTALPSASAGFEKCPAVTLKEAAAGMAGMVHSLQQGSNIELLKAMRDGFGGVKVSRAEQSTLTEVKSALHLA